VALQNLARDTTVYRPQLKKIDTREHIFCASRAISREGNKTQRHSQSMRDIYAPNLSYGPIAITLQQLDCLITERAVIKQQAADVF
jgi:hypothetical protein